MHIVIFHLISILQCFTRWRFGEFEEPSFFERPLEKSPAIGVDERSDREKLRPRSRQSEMFDVAKIAVAATTFVGPEGKCSVLTQICILTIIPRIIKKALFFLKTHKK